jgi:reactive intermediate/imine deaminase
VNRTIVSTPNAPQAIGTYSQAVKCGNTVYVSGQIPLDPATGNLVTGDMEAQIHRVFENLKAIINAAGGDFSHVA